MSSETTAQKRTSKRILNQLRGQKEPTPAGSSSDEEEDDGPEPAPSIETKPGYTWTYVQTFEEHTEFEQHMDGLGMRCATQSNRLRRLTFHCNDKQCPAKMLIQQSRDGDHFYLYQRDELSHNHEGPAQKKKGGARKSANSNNSMLSTPSAPSTNQLKLAPKTAHPPALKSEYHQQQSSSNSTTTTSKPPIWRPKMDAQKFFGSKTTANDDDGKKEEETGKKNEESPREGGEQLENVVKKRGGGGKGGGEGMEKGTVGRPRGKKRNTPPPVGDTSSTAGMKVPKLEVTSPTSTNKVARLRSNVVVRSASRSWVTQIPPRVYRGTRENMSAGSSPASSASTRVRASLQQHLKDTAAKKIKAEITQNSAIGAELPQSSSTNRETTATVEKTADAQQKESKNLEKRKTPTSPNKASSSSSAADRQVRKLGRHLAALLKDRAANPQMNSPQQIKKAPPGNVNEIPSPRTPPPPASRQNVPAVNNPPSPRTPPPPPLRQNVFVPAGSPPTPPPPSKERVQQRQNVFDFAHPPLVGDNVPPPCMRPMPPPMDQRQNGMATVSDPQPSQDDDRVPSPSTPPRPILTRESKISASAAALVSNPNPNLNNINNGAAASPLTPPVDPNPTNSSSVAAANGMNGPPPPPAFLQQNSQQFKLLQHRPQMEQMLASQLGLNLREESGCLLVSSSNPPLSNRVLVFTDEGDTIQIAEFIDDLMQETLEEWKKLDIGQFLRAVHGKCMAFFRRP